MGFSYSRMSMYLECPLKFKFRYIDKIPEKPKYYFAFGHSVHNALEFLYGVKAPPFPSLDETLHAFDRDWRGTSWMDKGYFSAEKAEEDFLKGRQMIAAYHRKHAGTFEVPLAVEYKSNLKIDGLSVMIVVDRIDYLGDGRISIVDYKTGKDVKRNPDQLHMYQKICESDPELKKTVNDRSGEPVENVRVDKLVFYHVPSLKENVFKRSPDVELKEFWTKVLGVADKIESGQFQPSPGERQCKFCDYQRFCPVFSSPSSDLSGSGSPGPLRGSHGSPSPAGGLPSRQESGAAGPDSAHQAVEKGPASQASQEDLSDEELLTELADRYGELKEHIRLSETEAEELKNKIVSMMKEKKYHQHYGKKFKLHWESEEKWVFKNRKLVVDTLKELGLYDKTLTPTQASIQRLLSDPGVPGDSRDRLKGLAEKTLHITLRCDKL